MSTTSADATRSLLLKADFYKNEGKPLEAAKILDSISTTTTDPDLRRSTARDAGKLYMRVAEDRARLRTSTPEQRDDKYAFVAGAYKDAADAFTRAGLTLEAKEAEKRRIAAAANRI